MKSAQVFIPIPFSLLRAIIKYLIPVSEQSVSRRLASSVVLMRRGLAASQKDGETPLRRNTKKEKQFMITLPDQLIIMS